MRPKLCNLCKKKLEKIVVVANKIYGDKSKEKVLSLFEMRCQVYESTFKPQRRT